MKSAVEKYYCWLGLQRYSTGRYINRNSFYPKKLCPGMSHDYII